MAGEQYSTTKSLLYSGYLVKAALMTPAGK
jgi:hypothetical protein